MKNTKLNKSINKTTTFNQLIWLNSSSSHFSSNENKKKICFSDILRTLVTTIIFVKALYKRYVFRLYK